MNDYYDYKAEMYTDICDYINENINLEDYINDDEFDRDELEEKLYDDCFIADSVTGNASGSYYCSRYKAREAIRGNEEDLIDALECFGAEAEEYKRAIIDPEYADVTIRCYYLGEVIARVLDDIEEAFNEAETGVELAEILEAVKGA